MALSQYMLESFVVGRDNFEDIRINQTPNKNFYWLSNFRRGDLIKRFVLGQSSEVCHVCEVTLIKKQDERFTPRIHFSVRYLKEPTKFATTKTEHLDDSRSVKASVDLSDCHKNFWDLISYLKSMHELDISDERFSLMGRDTTQIVTALRKREYCDRQERSQNAFIFSWDFFFRRRRERTLAAQKTLGGF